MVDLLQQASAWLDSMRKAQLSHQVTYGRGDASIVVQASVGNSTFEIDTGYGTVETWESRDFLISAGDLVIGGAATLPQPGDQITDGGSVYEVMGPGKENCWRWSDPYHNTLRIHTKQVGV